MYAEDYDDLHQYSVENWSYWQDLWEYSGILYSVPPTKARLYSTTLIPQLHDTGAYRSL